MARQTSGEGIFDWRMASRVAGGHVRQRDRFELPTLPQGAEGWGNLSRGGTKPGSKTWASPPASEWQRPRCVPGDATLLCRCGRRDTSQLAHFSQRTREMGHPRHRCSTVVRGVIAASYVHGSSQRKQVPFGRLRAGSYRAFGPVRNDKIKGQSQRRRTRVSAPHVLVFDVLQCFLGEPATYPPCGKLRAGFLAKDARNGAGRSRAEAATAPAVASELPSRFV